MDEWMDRQTDGLRDRWIDNEWMYCNRQRNVTLYHKMSCAI